MSPVEVFVTRIKMESIDQRANHKIKVNSKLQNSMDEQRTRGYQLSYCKSSDHELNQSSTVFAD